MIVRIGVAELSLWLLGLTGLAALLAGAALRRAGGRGVWVPRLALAAGLIGAGIASIPGSQLPDSIDNGAVAMRTALGRDYEFQIPETVAATFRPAPFSFADYLTGIDPGPARLTPNLPYRTVGGRTLLLDRYDPPTPGPHPGLLIIHGGGWESGDKGEYTEASRYFAARGYLVYDIQYRLSRGGTLPRATGRRGVRAGVYARPGRRRRAGPGAGGRHGPLCRGAPGAAGRLPRRPRPGAARLRPPGDGPGGHRLLRSDRPGLGLRPSAGAGYHPEPSPADGVAGR